MEILLILVIIILIIQKPVRQIVLKAKDNQNLFEQRLVYPLLPPERTNVPRIPINIHTQGIPPSYQQVGFVYQESSASRYPLFGRPEYNGSTLFEYYIKDDSRNMLKIPLNQRTELYSGDVIDISGISGSFVVEIYDLDQPKYIPYI